MRRGLICRSPVELPDAVLEARLNRVRAAMHEAQRDALIIYTNITGLPGCPGSPVSCRTGRKRC